MAFDFATAEKLLREGKEVKRLGWSGDAILCLCKNGIMVKPSVEGSKVQLLDRYYWAFWDLTSEDRVAVDWVMANNSCNNFEF